MATDIPVPHLCTHRNAVIRGGTTFGLAYCPNCEKEVLLMDVFNAVLSEMRDHLTRLNRYDKEMDNLITQLKALL